MPPISTKALKSIIHSEILKRMSYGVREEVVPRASRLMNWSNSGGWFLYPNRYKLGQKVKLDANQILVPEVHIRSIREWVDRGILPPLPLAQGSFEATKEGKSMLGEELPLFVRERTRQLNPQIEEAESLGRVYREEQGLRKAREVEARRKALRVVGNSSAEAGLLNQIFRRRIE